MSIADMRLCIGGQDGTVAAFSVGSENDGLLALEADFAQETHSGAIRSMALEKGTLITGGADEVVKVYDVTRQRERCFLCAHNGEVGAVTLLNDPSGKGHALTGDNSGTLCVWRARDWTHLKTLEAHNSAILAVSAHPTGMLAISTSDDRALLMWDLSRGKVVFSAKTKCDPVSRVVWSSDGERYYLAAGLKVSVNGVDGQPSGVMRHDKPVSDVSAAKQGPPNELVTGSDDGIVRLWDTRSEKVQRAGPTHSRKVAGVAVVERLVFSVDVRGGLKLWDLRGGREPRIDTHVGISASVIEASLVEANEGSDKQKRKRNSERKESSEKEVDCDTRSAQAEKTRKKKRRSRR